jgi:hypothetical protein
LVGGERRPVRARAIAAGLGNEVGERMPTAAVGDQFTDGIAVAIASQILVGDVEFLAEITELGFVVGFGYEFEEAGGKGSDGLFCFLDRGRKGGMVNEKRVLLCFGGGALALEAG